MWYNPSQKKKCCIQAVPLEVEATSHNEKNILTVDKRWVSIVIINGLRKNIFLLKIFGLKFGGFNLLFFR